MEKEKNSFLITCVSCIVLLLLMCYFGINSSFKSTQAAGIYTCGSGYDLVSEQWCCPANKGYVGAKYFNGIEGYFCYQDGVDLKLGNGYQPYCAITLDSEAACANMGAGWTVETSTISGVYCVNTNFESCAPVATAATYDASGTAVQYDIIYNIDNQQGPTV